MYSIPADADNRPAALAFINAMLEPANNAVINDALAQAVTVDEAIDLVSESNRLLYPYEDLEHFFAITPLMSLPYGSHGVTMSDFLDEYSTLVAGG